MVISSELLDKFYGRYQKRLKDFKINKEYTKGRNPPIRRQDKRRDPDNRIPVPLAKVAVDDMQGYAGRPGDRKVYWENTSNQEEGDGREQAKESEFVDMMTKVYDYNKEPLETSELYKDALVYGVGYEILWASVVEGKEYLQPEFKRIDNPAAVEIIYSNDLKPQKLAALYFWKDNVNDACYVDVYFPGYKERWTKTKSAWVKSVDGNEEYPYKSVPVVAFRANSDMDALFEAEKPLIDAHDSLLSKSVNEVDRFNAIITLLPNKITKELKDKLQEIQVFDKLENIDADKWPKYLEKNLAGISDFYAGLADRLERLFHKSIKDPDMTDESFAAQSGIAIAYKLVGLEFKASEIDTYFNQGIHERDNLIKDVVGLVGVIGVDEYKTVIKTHRNLPVDEKSKLEIAMSMLAIGVSKESILKYLPVSIIENAEKELERIDNNKPSNDNGNPNILEGDE